MLRKLMKYEFMATGRIFLPLFAALIIISIVNRLLSILGLNTTSVSVIGTVVSVILMAGIAVLTFILTLQRFRNNLLSSEGYLMMTLPAKTDSLILSKLFVSAIWIVASVVVVTVSIMILAMTSFDFSDLVALIRNLIELLPRFSIRYVIYTAEALIGIVVSLFSGVLLLYACLSLSMLVDKRRGLFAFGAYIVITTALQIIGAIIAGIAAALNITDLFDFSSWSTFGQVQLVILLILLADVILCAAFYFVTRYMLKRRLNLQ